MTTEVTSALSEKRKGFLHSVFTTAMEGGVQYWAHVTAYHWMKADPPEDASSDSKCDIDGFHAVLVPVGDAVWGVWDGEQDRKKLRVDTDVLVKGIKLFTRYCRGEINALGRTVPEAEQVELAENHYWRQFLVAEITSGDDGDYDADVAEQIVQWGLFGQAMYG